MLEDRYLRCIAGREIFESHNKIDSKFELLTESLLKTRTLSNIKAWSPVTSDRRFGVAEECRYRTAIGNSNKFLI